MPRMTGESVADYAARVRFEKERRKWQKQDEEERAKMAAAGKPRPTNVKYIDTPCTCRAYPFPHYHGGTKPEIVEDRNS